MIKRDKELLSSFISGINNQLGEMYDNRFTVTVKENLNQLKHNKVTILIYDSQTYRFTEKKFVYKTHKCIGSDGVAEYRISPEILDWIVDYMAQVQLGLVKDRKSVV